MPQRPEVTIVHEIEGRIRMRLSQSPQSPERMYNLIKGHPGVISIEYTPLTKSVLSVFNPSQVSREEIVVRVAFSLALDYGAVPVRILAEPEVKEMTNSAFYSGFLLAASLAARALGISVTGRKGIDQIAGIGTAAAVIEHGWREVQHRGNFDPEVLSIVYLLSTFMRGNFLSGALFTWATTFGRHIIRTQPSGVELRPMAMSSNDEGEPKYEIVMESDKGKTNQVNLLGIIPTLLQYLLTGGTPDRKDLMGEIRVLSKVHGEVLEGLGEMRQGIPIRLRQ